MLCSTEHRDRIYVKRYVSFVINIGKNGRGKYSQKPFDSAKQSAKDTLKTALKRAIKNS